MKKLVSLLLVVALSLSVLSFAMAEVDLSSMTTDELISLRTLVYSELIARGEVKSMTVPTGKYIIGEDIPAGTYSVSTNQFFVSVVIGDYDEYYSLTDEDGIGKLVLKDGQIFENSGKIVLTKYAGLSFD